MTTGIVIPTFNRRATVLSALKSLFEVLPPDHHVIVVDSGSPDGTAREIKKLFPQVFLLQGHTSVWWAAGTNLGVIKTRELKCSHVLTYNDDNIATKSLFEVLAKTSRLYPNSIISAVCCHLDRPDTVFFAGRMRAKRSDRFYYLDQGAPLSDLEKGIRQVDLLHGMCTLFPMSVFDRVGLFDEITFPQVFADDDLILRAYDAGYRLLVALESVILNDRTKTGINPYQQRLGPVGIWRLLTSRSSTFQLSARTRFLWRHRQSFWSFCKTWLYDYLRLLTLVVAKWVLPTRTFQWAGKKWIQQLSQK